MAKMRPTLVILVIDLREAEFLFRSAGDLSTEFPDAIDVPALDAKPEAAELPEKTG